MLRGGSNREQESRLCDDLPVDDSAGCRISGEPARLQGGYLSDEDDLNDGYDENEEAEGLVSRLGPAPAPAAPRNVF